MAFLFRLLTKELVIYQDNERKRIVITSARTVRKNLTKRIQRKTQRATTIDSDMPIVPRAQQKGTPEIKSFRTCFLNIFQDVF